MCREQVCVQQDYIDPSMEFFFDASVLFFFGVDSQGLANMFHRTTTWYRLGRFLSPRVLSRSRLVAALISLALPRVETFKSRRASFSPSPRGI